MTKSAKEPDAFDAFLTSPRSYEGPRSAMFQWPGAIQKVEAYLQARSEGRTKKSIRQFHRWLQSAAQTGGLGVEPTFCLHYDSLRNFMDTVYPELYRRGRS